MAITKSDEYFIHQTYETVDNTAVDKERLYFGCHNADGRLHLAIGLGVYPEKKMMDAYVCCRFENTQYNIRLSRPITNGDLNDLQIGPLSFKIIEPLKRWAVKLDDNELGISCSLTFTGLDEPYLATLSSMAFLQYNQPGEYSGQITVGGNDIDATGFIGGRDRSWRENTPASIQESFGGHFWMMARLPESWLFLHGFPLFNVPSPADFDGVIADFKGNNTPIAQVLHRIEFLPGIRSIKQADLQLVLASGETRQLKIKPKSAGTYFSGAGYESKIVERAGTLIDGEKWDVSQPADLGSERFGAVGMTQYIADFELDNEKGVGILEVSYSPDKDRPYKPSW